MNDTHKLLLAFIEASGFEVEKVTDYQETEILAMEGRGIIESIQYGVDNSYQLKIHNGEYVRGANSEYTRMLKNPIVDYKVNNKGANSIAMVPLPIRSEAWGCIIKFVANHRNDIVNDINDFSDLKPIWEFMNRDCP